MSKLLWTPIGEVSFAGIDFESAGARPGATDVPVQIGWAILREGQIHPEQFFRRFLYTDRPITWSAAKVHGISPQDLEKAESMDRYWPTMKQYLSPCVLVAHGHATEKRFLRHFPTHGLGPWVDTLALSRKWCKGLSSHRLEEVHSRLGLETECRKLCPHYNWHDALFDAVACLIVLRHLIREGKLEDLPLGQIVVGSDC